MRAVFITLILLCSCMLAATGQKIRFTDTTNIWTVESGIQSETPLGVIFSVYDMKYFQDTIANGIIYHITGGTWAREDTAEGRVYYYDPYDSTEYVLYDYNLQAGDTIIHYPQFSADWYADSIIHVDSMLIRGVYHKIFTYVTIAYNSVSHPLIYVEGIGSLLRPDWPLNAPCFEGDRHVICFSTDGSRPDFSVFSPTCGGSDYDTLRNGDNGCLPQWLSLPAAAALPPAIQHANPLHAADAFRLNRPMEQGTITVYDAMGRQVAHTAIANTDQLPVGSWLHIPGVYYYVLTDDRQQMSLKGHFLFQ